MIASRRRFLESATATGAWISLQKPAALLDRQHEPADVVPLERIARDPLRPQFHLLPARNWMNDPNGPIFWKGNYHMFFQYNPNAAVWGDMHWAHAISADMIHWKHLPVALAPRPGGYDEQGCFSGSAVDNQGAATILYTGVRDAPTELATLRDDKHNFLEVQCLATSTDSDLRTWQKLSQPVLLPPRDPRLTGFRDPCLWRAVNAWFMGIGSGIRGEGGRVLLYRSEDLSQWEYLHPLASGKTSDKQAKEAVHVGDMWECPDFFPLGGKHILLYSTGGKVYWQAGEFDAKELIFHPQEQGVADHGTFYAAKSQLDAKGRRILRGWINETRPEAEFSAAGWAGCMSLPRFLTLADDGTLRMAIIPEVAQLRETQVSLSAQAAEPKTKQKVPGRIELRAATAEIELLFRPKPLHLTIADGAREIFALSFDAKRSGKELQIGDFAINSPVSHNQPHRLHIFLDASVVECFLDDRLACTARSYLTAKANLQLQIPEAHQGNVTPWQSGPCAPFLRTGLPPERSTLPASTHP
jgi:beta-fructofuranosidase